MRKETVVSAKTVEEAVAKAVEELGAKSAQDIEYTVLEEPKKGLFGIGAVPAKISASYTVGGEYLALEFLQKLVADMELDLTVTLGDGDNDDKLISIDGENAGVLIDDCVYAVKVDGEYQTVSTLGYSKALAAFRGPKGTTAEFLVLRKNENGGYRTVAFSVARDAYEAETVTHRVSEKDPTVGIVYISGFELITPKQFKESVNALLALGVEHFVFDVRNNPGGDVQSVKAILTYFLKEGDLILSAIDKAGKVAVSFCAEPIDRTDEMYSACNVSKDEIGMYADLDMVVLCNANTASSAEIFTATMRDYGLAKIVGETTFGKGILQSILPLSDYSDYEGYFKFTSYAYVTQCGIPYHGIGVSPTEGLEVSLSEQAQKYPLDLLPEALDDQLLLAIAQFAD